jgi:hypothetical protein
VIIGRDGPFQTILDASRSWTGAEGSVLDSSGDPTALVLRVEGVTIQHGTGAGSCHEGGGVRIATYHVGDSATFGECRFVDNRIPEQDGRGGAIYALSPDITFENCFFSGNTVAYAGGLVFLLNASVRFEGCGINLDEGAYQIEMNDCSSLTMIRSTVQNGPNGGGYFLSYGADRFDLEDNTFVSTGAKTWLDPLVVTEGLINLQDNVVADPLLCHESEPNFTVAETSPCTAEHSPAGCGVIGSAEIGSNITPVERMSWGRIKSTFNP